MISVNPVAKLDSPKWQIWFSRLTRLSLIGLILIYSGWLTYAISADRPLDFYVYYLAAEIFATGGDAYTISKESWNTIAAELGITNFAYPYRYPPLTATLILPLRAIGPQGAAAIWVAASAIAMIAGGWLLARLYPSPYSRFLSLFLLLIMVAPLVTLDTGQVNGLLYLCLVLGLIWLIQDRPCAAAIALAVGALLKVLPLALILYLFWRKQWRLGALAMAALFLLFFAAIPLVGWENCLSYLQHAVSRGEPNFLIVRSANQTISALLGRLFTERDPELVLWWARWLALAVTGATALACVPIGRFKEYVVAEYALIVAALQMIAPFTWYHQLLLLHIPLFVVCARAVQSQHWRRLVLWFGLLTLFDVHGMFWHQVEDTFGKGWWMSAPLLVTFSLWVALAIQIVQRKWRQWKRH
jgi:hypothetical protein